MGDYELIIGLTILCLVVIMINFFILKKEIKQLYFIINVVVLIAISVICRNLELANNEGGQSLGAILLWMGALGLQIAINLIYLLFRIGKKLRSLFNNT